VRRERNFDDDSSARSACQRGIEGPNRSESPRADSLKFDRFRRSVTLVSGRLCKKIRNVEVRASSIVRAKRGDRYAQILFRNCAESQLPPLQKSLFHRIFCNHGDTRTNLFAHRTRAQLMMTVVTRVRRRVPQLTGVHVSLSGNAVFFAVL
jgi:hypothetical protein